MGLMTLRFVIFQRILHQLPVWPLRTLRMLFYSTKRGNVKYILMFSFCFAILFLTTNKQSDLMERDEMPENALMNYTAAVIRNVNQNTKEHRVKTLPKPNSKKCGSVPKQLMGNMTINPNITPSYEEVRKISGPNLMKGGCHIPTDCKASQKVAIIIPFKDRDSHLRTLMYYLHPMLIRQKSYYCIYVVEQFDEGQFNKAMIMNAGFEEVMKIDDYDCIIFHDVDMIPENDKNMYLCGLHPKHLSPAIDKFKYQPHYGTEFGGVTGITPEQYRKANGHSNKYWGWGGEDNDIEFRIGYNGMRILTPPLHIGRYTMIKHDHPWKFKPGDFPYSLNQTGKWRAKVDGLSDLAYRKLNTTAFPTYTKLMIDIRRIEVKAITMFVDGKKVMNVDVFPKGKCQYVKFDNKHLDFKIELSGVKKAQPYLKTKTQVQKEKDNKNAHIPPPSSHRYLLDTFEHAVKVCEALQPLCLGIVKELNNKYSVRRGGIPKNLVVSIETQPKILRQVKLGPNRKIASSKRYIFPAQMSYLRYCPGVSGSIQKLETVIPIDLSKERSVVQHRFSFEIQFTMLMQPTETIYYKDIKKLEGSHNVKESFYTFKWRASDFSSPNSPKDFFVRTGNFSVPSVPGCFAVESKIVSREMDPYFQWNWWFEVASGDKIKDVENRTEFYKILNQEVVDNTHERRMKEKEKKQKKKEYMFNKEMAALRKEPFKIIPEFESEIPNLPPYLQEKLKEKNILPKVPGS